MQQASPSAVAGATSSCVGREQELQQLAGLYAEARERGERIAFLEGPSGIGKSRILTELRGRIRLEGGVVLDGRCEPGRAFGPFADIVEQALRFLNEVGAAASVDLADLGCRVGCHRFWHQHGSDRDVHAREREDQTEVEALEKRLRFFDAIRGLLRDVARVRAPVVVLHDLERADSGTVQLLTFLLEAAGPFGDDVVPGQSLHALFVASVRAGADDTRLAPLLRHGSAARIAVGALDADGVRALLTSHESVARVLARTGGLPEAIESLLDAEPPTPEARLERKLAELPAAARELAFALAVIERPSDVAEIGRVAGVAADASARSEFGKCELLARTIVDGAMLFSFAREADRERAYAHLTAAQRRELHARAAVVLTDVDAQAAARHALLAGDIARAVPLALEATRSLVARHAQSDAAVLLEAVLEAAGAAAPPALCEQLADLYRASGDYRRALVHARVVRERAPHDGGAARRVGDLLTLAGALDDAAEALADARRLAHASGDPLETAEVDARLAELNYQRAAHGEAHDRAAQALAAAETLGTLPLSLAARNTLGKVALAQRDADAAVAYFEENRRRASAAGFRREEAQSLTNLGVAMLRKQDLAAAEESFARAIEVATEAGDTRERAIATENLAVLAHVRHDYGLAQSRYNDAVAMLKRLGNRAMLARVANNLGELYLSLGDHERARTLCEFATHVGGAALPPSVAAEGLLLRGRVEAALGDGASARAVFEAARRTFTKLGMRRASDATLELARLALHDGDVPRARGLLAELATNESPKRAAEVATLAADVARAAGEDALPHAAQAVSLAIVAADDALRLAAEVRHARALAETGDISAALSALEEARAAEARLAACVPEAALPLWQQRAARVDLSRAEALLSAVRTRPRASDRPASVPPGRTEERATETRDALWRERYPQIVGSGPAVHGVLALIDRIAPSDCLVLIRGESGTGKELVADAIHNGSPRKDRPFVKVNCAALVETLLLSELFGHERGAFTGASARKKGRFEVADGGTIFLDEIGDISPKTQVALLRVLQEREFERVGGTAPIKVDVRILCATHRDLEKMVERGEFREDLYYRLRGVAVDMPALRRRRDDLEAIATHLLGRIAKERGEAPKTLSPEALAMLRAHRWPGNVRELDNVLRSASLFADGPVLGTPDLAAFAETFRGDDPEPELAFVKAPRVPAEAELAGAPRDSEVELAYRRIRGGEVSLFEMKKQIERECIARALEETGGNITRAAALLGMKRPRLSQLVKEYELSASGEA